MFKPVSSKLNANAMELSILEFWKKEDIFHASINNREGNPEYVFYVLKHYPGYSEKRQTGFNNSYKPPIFCWHYE